VLKYLQLNAVNPCRTQPYGCSQFSITQNQSLVIVLLILSKSIIFTMLRIGCKLIKLTVGHCIEISDGHLDLSSSFLWGYSAMSFDISVMMEACSDLHFYRLLILFIKFTMPLKVSLLPHFILLKWSIGNLKLFLYVSLLDYFTCVLL
jgi:hypothetical protein